MIIHLYSHVQVRINSRFQSIPLILKFKYCVPTVDITIVGNMTTVRKSHPNPLSGSRDY